MGAVKKKLTAGMPTKLAKNKMAMPVSNFLRFNMCWLPEMCGDEWFKRMGKG
jgi:hypothetical protein